VKFIRDAIVQWAENREPDFIIGGREDPYLKRHWLIPRNRFLNIYVHEFLRSDDDRALHDHPWLFNASWLIDGCYVEHTIAEGGVQHRTQRVGGDWKFRWGPAPHRVELQTMADLLEDAGIEGAQVWPWNAEPLPCWTVFITGPRCREWGFHCPDQGWIHWKRFTAPDDQGAIGKGCDA